MKIALITIQFIRQKLNIEQIIAIKMTAGSVVNFDVILRSSESEFGYEKV